MAVSYNIFKLLSGLSCLVNKTNMELLLSLLYIFCVFSLLISEKAVRYKLLTDVATIVVILRVNILDKFDRLLESNILDHILIV